MYNVERMIEEVQTLYQEFKKLEDLSIWSTKSVKSCSHLGSRRWRMKSKN